MKKQELIKHIEDLPYKEGPIVDKIDISRKGLLELVKQLDEPQKPVVQQFVADWYEKHKYALEFNIFDYVYRFEQMTKNDFKDWFNDINNKAIQILVNMHQFGYEVEKEKRYRISMPKARNYKNHAQILCEKDGKMFWCGEWYSFRAKFTRKQLEEAGFGWVFDCPGVEVEEVE